MLLMKTLRKATIAIRNSAQIGNATRAMIRTYSVIAWPVSSLTNALNILIPLAIRNP